MSLQTDHLVIAASSLEQGVGWLQKKIAIELPKGGEHPVMGTHNHLMSLGNNTFIEVIAVNPSAPSPNRPRWFGLDDPTVVASLEDSPKLLTWAVNTPDIHSILKRSSCHLGDAHSLTRGDLSWLISIREDGSLPAGGLLPAVLQWHCESHPSNLMKDLGCRLKSIRLSCRNPQWLERQLDSISASSLVEITASSKSIPPGVSVVLSTPKGDVTF